MNKGAVNKGAVNKGAGVGDAGRRTERARRPAPDPAHLAWSEAPDEPARRGSAVRRGSVAAGAAAAGAGAAAAARKRTPVADAAATPSSNAGYAPRQEPQPLTGYAPRADRPAGGPPHVGRPGPSNAQQRGTARPAQAPRPGADPASRGRNRKNLFRRPARSSSTPRRKRHVGRIALIVVVALVVAMIAAVFYYDSKLTRVDALASYAGRPGNAPGTTWLIVGSDSRSDLTQEQKDNLATGDSDGSRTDTIMLVHKPPSGKSMIISIPRDLYVNIPDYGMHKVNAAFNFGGPQLLVRTVEELSGLRIDHYGEIGFGGFDTLVDSVGGVQMCLDQALDDPKAGLKLPAGCQTLNGKQALGLVRTRAFPNADLERVVNQRKFLSALMSKATGPSVLLNPFRLVPFVNGAVGSLTVDNGDHIWNLIGLAFALRSDPITTTTPIGGNEYTDDGDALSVGDDTTQFFEYLRKGQPVPENLLSTGGGAVG